MNTRVLIDVLEATKAQLERDRRAWLRVARRRRHVPRVARLEAGRKAHIPSPMPRRSTGFRRLCFGHGRSRLTPLASTPSRLTARS